MNTTSLHPVCVTGIGVITPFAVGWNDVVRQLAEGIPHYALWNEEFERPFEGARLGLVKNYPKERFFTERQLRQMDKAMSLCSVASALALEDAGLLTNGGVENGDEVATILGSARGEVASQYRFGMPLFRPIKGRAVAAHFPTIARNVACGQVAIRFNLRGWSTMIKAGDASGAHVLARGAEMIRLGRADVVVAGAYEVLSQLSLHQTKRCWREEGRIEALGRIGTNDHVPVEGACFFILESATHAAARGRTPYGVIDTVTHGYRFEHSARDWYDIVGKHMAGGASGLDNGIRFHVSTAAAFDETNPLREREHALDTAVNRFCSDSTVVQSRPVFGEAASLNVTYATAMALQALHDRATADVAPASALVSSITGRNAYALISLSNCQR